MGIVDENVVENMEKWTGCHRQEEFLGNTREQNILTWTNLRRFRDDIASPTD